MVSRQDSWPIFREKVWCVPCWERAQPASLYILLGVTLQTLGVAANFSQLGQQGPNSFTDSSPGSQVSLPLSPFSLLLSCFAFL